MPRQVSSYAVSGRGMECIKKFAEPFRTIRDESHMSFILMSGLLHDFCE
jgi:hypothetical protein